MQKTALLAIILGLASGIGSFGVWMQFGLAGQLIALPIFVVVSFLVVRLVV